MGTLLWQLDDCWPVASWSITDYSRQPKAAWYAVKEVYRDDIIPVKDSVYPKNLKLQKPDFAIILSGNEISIRCNTDARYVFLSSTGDDINLSDNYFNLLPGETKTILADRNLNAAKLKIRSLYDIEAK
jgi:beta-mannosidase